MQPIDPVNGKLARRPLSLVTVALLAVAVASCASGGNKAVITMPNQDVLPPETFLSQGYCPPVKIRPGTESFRVYERGHDGEGRFVVYQASIAQTARECHHLGGGQLNMHVGIAGRVVGGAKAVAGSVTLPVRVAVIKQAGGTVFFSQVFKVPVPITAPTFAADFSQVFDQVNLTLTGGDRDLLVYVGFDEGPPKPTG